MTPFGIQTVPGKMAGMKLYVVTRRDLPPGAQAVQSCHVLLQFSYEYLDVGRSWFIESNTLALLTVADEPELMRLMDDATKQKIRCSAFKEPDYNNAVTAIALEPGAKTRRLVARLPLTLSTGRK